MNRSSAEDANADDQCERKKSIHLFLL
jgi:hypothetical protein